MAKFTARFDDRTTAMLEGLSRSEGVPKTHVLRRALVLLQHATDARDRGERLTISDDRDRLVKEILL